MPNPFENIEHIVVLMMENRSFDNMLGWQFGLSPENFNRNLDGRKVYVWPRPDDPPGNDMTIPDPDPGELFTDMNYQLFGKINPEPEDEPNMSGFLKNYAAKAQVTGVLNTPNDIMHCYQPEQLPATSLLATAFGISDRWHASAPCQTWPNRLFAACATADGYVNNLPVPPEHPRDVLKRLPFKMPTIFNQFREHLFQFDKGWRIYFHDISVNFMLSKLWEHLDHFHFYERFQEDVCGGHLQSYTFIEPRYFVDLSKRLMPNDSHPPYNVHLGEELIADVYNTLRSNEAVWEKTLLVVTYDEHGGCYDSYTGNLHPGSALSPEKNPVAKPNQYDFIFNRFGVRVPTLLISPYIQKSSIHRAPEESTYPFDHTTIIKSVKECFSLDFDQLTERDGHAPSLANVLSDTIVNPGPKKIEVPTLEVSDEMLAQAASAPLSDFQRLLQIAASILPEKAQIEARLAALSDDDTRIEMPLGKTPEEALTFIKDKVGAFIQR